MLCQDAFADYSHLQDFSALSGKLSHVPKFQCKNHLFHKAFLSSMRTGHHSKHMIQRGTPFTQAKLLLLEVLETVKAPEWNSGVWITLDEGLPLDKSPPALGHSPGSFYLPCEGEEPS